MKRIICIVIVVLMVSQVCWASPLNDFTQGTTIVNVNSSVTTFVGSDCFDFTITTGLGNDWAGSYRQTGYDTNYNHSSYDVKNRELNVLRKINNNIQLYAGYSQTKGYDKVLGQHLPDKSVMQVGIIASKKLGDKTTLYTLLGGGRNVTNVEFGLSQKLTTGLDMTAIYRHLTIEKVGPSQTKENLRGFGLGLTFQM